MTDPGNPPDPRGTNREYSVQSSLGLWGSNRPERGATDQRRDRCRRRTSSDDTTSRRPEHGRGGSGGRRNTTLDEQTPTLTDQPPSP